MWMFGPTPGGIWDASLLDDESTVTRVEVPGTFGQAFILKNCASPAACAALVAESEEVGFLNEEDTARDPRGPRIRKNGSLSWILSALAAANIFSRVTRNMPQKIIAHRRWSKPSAADVTAAEEASHWVREVDGAPTGAYEIAGLNQRCRIYRYRAGSGDVFPRHLDEVGAQL